MSNGIVPADRITSGIYDGLFDQCLCCLVARLEYCPVHVLRSSYSLSIPRVKRAESPLAYAEYATFYLQGCHHVCVRM